MHRVPPVSGTTTTMYNTMVSIVVCSCVEYLWFGCFGLGVAKVLQ